MNSMGIGGIGVWLKETNGLLVITVSNKTKNQFFEDKGILWWGDDLE